MYNLKLNLNAFLNVKKKSNNFLKIFTVHVFYYRDTPEQEGHRCKLFKPEMTSMPSKSVIDETKSTVSGASEFWTLQSK